MSASCPSVGILEPANSERIWKHRAPMLLYDWSIQPHVALPLQNRLHFVCISTFYLPHFAMKLQAIS